MRTPRILVLDGNAEIGLALSFMLELEGFEVAVTPDAARALRLQKRLPADILLADTCEGQVDLSETLARFRREFPGTRIVAMLRGGGRPGSQLPPNDADIVLRRPFETRPLVDTLQALAARGPRLTIP